MNKNETALIKKALLHIETNEVSLMESFPKIDLPHSRQYTEYMEGLVFSNSAVKDKRGFSKKKLLACIIAAILALVTACTFREPILDFFEKAYESFTKLSTNEDAGKEITAVYMPDYIPDGYEIISESKNKIGVSVIWSNGNERITYNQSPLNNENILIDTGSNDYVCLYIEKQPVYYIYQNNTYFFIWENGDYTFKLKCSDTIIMEEIEKIISSIHKENQGEL